MTTLDISDLHWAYSRGARQVALLDNVNLSMAGGEVIALLGQSGSGKSTLLNLISGIEPLQGGEISLDGHQLSTQSEEERTLYRRKHIGFIYQFFNLIPTLTVSENISLVLELNAEPRRSIEEKVTGMLAALSMSDKASDFPDVLSGGEQQRVALGRALIHQPALVLADEPTGNLEARTGKTILELLLEQTRARDTSLLIVTHSKAVAERADRVLALVEGALVEGGGELAW